MWMWPYVVVGCAVFNVGAILSGATRFKRCLACGARGTLRALGTTRADGGALHDDRGQPVRVKGKNAYAEHYECAACGAAQVQCGTRPMMARAAWEAEAADRRARAEAALHAARTPLPAARAVKLPRSSPRPISSPSPGGCPPGPRRA